MKLTNLVFLAFLFLTIGLGQQLSVVNELEDSIHETSGLIYLDNKIISVSDSGDPVLSEIDSESGDVTRSVVISNATNYDWEDITEDENYLYIGDIGNNFGDRTDLKIYRLSKEEYSQAANDTVTADIIHYSYADQTDFTHARYYSNYDAEALVAYKDSLYIFTKNWGDRSTNVYAIPKTPGTYTTEKIDSIDTKGLVTGATYNKDQNKIVLSGNDIPSPFVVELSDFSDGLFSNGIVEKHSIQPPLGYSVQVEGITFTKGDSLYLTAEENVLGSSALYKMDLSEKAE